ncbi:acyltransferase [Caballeronia sp. LP006]|uniref:acyltransferase family protein n=1 Tax=Caballeronia sp. LP006 TaxID=3038552 RepID=UPI002863645E|nr:acyltransferase [Caballeronia sp. LP006]MDR5827180.1 acyltransferase [Caballeronia sp. LP006]
MVDLKNWEEIARLVRKYFRCTVAAALATSAQGSSTQEKYKGIFLFLSLLFLSCHLSTRQDRAKMNEKIRGFDGLRGIAVFLVFLHHKAMAEGTGLGHLGVWIFFALSGFLITDILTTQRRYIDAGTSTFGAELKRFLYRRTLRIFPIYYLLLATLAVLMTMGFAGPELAGGMPYHFVYLSNFWIADVLHAWPGRYSHLWSLSIEEQFYIVFAPLLLGLRADWHGRICWLVLALGVGSLFTMKALHDSPIAIYTHPLTNFWLLALGGIGAAFVKRSRLRAPLYAVVIISTVIALLCFQEPEWERLANPYSYTALYVLYGACIAMLVCAIACSASGPLLRVLEWAPLAALGKISYGFYLYHGFIPDFYKSVSVKALFGASGVPWWARFLCVLASFALTWILARLSWRFIEAPILRLKNRRFMRVSVQGPANAELSGGEAR